MTQLISIERQGPFANQDDVDLMLKALFDLGTPKSDGYVLSELAICLPTILVALNWPGCERKVQEAIPYHSINLDEDGFLETMAHLGYIGRVENLEFSAIDDRLLPCVFIPDKLSRTKKNGLKHAVVMLPDDQTDIFQQASILCSGSKKYEAVPEKCTARGKAIFFKSLTEEHDIIADLSLKAENYSWFKRLMYRFKNTFKQVFWASLFINILVLAAPLFMMMVYDKVIGGQSISTLYYLAFGVALAIIAEFFLRTLRSKIMSWFGVRIDSIVSNEIFEKLMFLAPGYTERASVASQVAQLKNFQTVRDFFVGPMFLAYIELPFVMILIAAVAFIAGSLVLVPLILLGAYAVLIISTGPRLRRYTKQAIRANSERQKLLIESFNKMHCIRYSGAHRAWLERYRNVSGEASFSSFRANYLSSMIEIIAHSFSVMAGVAVLYFGVEKIWQAELSPGGLVAALILSWRVLAPLQSACITLPKLEQVKHSVEQVNRLMELPVEKNPNIHLPEAPNFSGHIAFSSVGLRYNKELDPVFAGLSFDVNPGEVVAITGGNGVGKSTILKLLNGMYHPQAGTIRIDGIDIRQLDPVELRQHISYMPQQPRLFQGSLLENIKLTAPLATPEIIEKALKDLGIWREVQKLPDGLMTQVHMRERTGLSSNLAYMIAMARSYINDNTIIMFDEMPYNILNSNAGLSHKQFIKKLKGDKTVFIVSYRQDFIELADVVVTLFSDGRPLVKYPGREKE